MPPPVRPGLPTHLLDHLGPAGDAVLDKDGVVAARAALTLVESLPAMTSALHERSAWLGYVRSLLVELGDACGFSRQRPWRVASATNSVTPRKPDAVATSWSRDSSRYS